MDPIEKEIRESIEVKNELIRSELSKISQASVLLAECLKKGGKVFFFGNGGSAADSQHLAAELVGRFRKERRAMPAIALTTDTSILTAIGNDYGFETVFERQLEALAGPQDLAVGLSTSGNSANVLRGLSKAKSMGLKTIGLTGKGGGKVRGIADLTIMVPSDKTARIQESHILIGHALCEGVDGLC